MNTTSGTPSRRVALATAGIAAGAAAVLGLGIAATAEARQVGPFGAAVSTTVGSTTATATSVDADVAAALQYNREEERLARDVYAALADRYDGAAPFSMITRSEQTHYDAIGVLLDRYGIVDPAEGRDTGDYADPTLQKLYDDLMAQGTRSLDAAYGVGVAIEKQDIADLDKGLAGTLPADVRTVLTSLRAGSENHLRAYQNAVDGTYVGGGYGTGQMGRWGDPTTTDDSTWGYGRMGGMTDGARGAAVMGAGDCLLTDTSV
jgi:hypothetical protein